MKKQIEIIDVLTQHYKGLEYRMKGNPTNEAEFNANFIVDKTNGVETPTWAKVQSYLAEMKTAYVNTKYQRDRQPEYASIPDQLDYIYHNGVEKWKTDMILPVKEKYPKGDS